MNAKGKEALTKLAEGVEKLASIVQDVDKRDRLKARAANLRQRVAEIQLK